MMESRSFNAMGTSSALGEAPLPLSGKHLNVTYRDPFWAMAPWLVSHETLTL